MKANDIKKLKFKIKKIKQMITKTNKVVLYNIVTSMEA